ncbi:MAG: Gfo/Idh/MocA family protein, partial [Longimicrobiales bacterium]
MTKPDADSGGPPMAPDSPVDPDSATEAMDPLAAVSEVTRRDFLKVAGVGVAAVGTTACVPSESETQQGPSSAGPPAGIGSPPAQPFAAPPIDLVRIGFVGVGGMGTAHVRNLVRIEGCVISAVCDVEPAHAERAAEIIVEAGHPRPTLYTNGETDYERLCAEADVDLVYTATPWRLHVPLFFPPLPPPPPPSP